MRQDYTVWVVVDPEQKNWFKVNAETIQGAAEQAAHDYDSRVDVDYALAKETVAVQVLVKDPTDVTGMTAFSFEVSCSLNPFYELSSGSEVIRLDE